MSFYDRTTMTKATAQAYRKTILPARIAAIELDRKQGKISHVQARYMIAAEKGWITRAEKVLVL